MCIDNKSSVFIASLEISERCAVEEWLGVRKGRRWRFDGVEMSNIRIVRTIVPGDPLVLLRQVI